MASTVEKRTVCLDRVKYQALTLVSEQLSFCVTPRRHQLGFDSTVTDVVVMVEALTAGPISRWKDNQGSKSERLGTKVVRKMARHGRLRLSERNAE